MYNRLFGDQIEASCERYNARKDQAYIDSLVDKRFNELIDPWLGAANAKLAPLLELHSVLDWISQGQAEDP